MAEIIKNPESDFNGFSEDLQILFNNAAIKEGKGRTGKELFESGLEDFRYSRYLKGDPSDVIKVFHDPFIEGHDD